jgi:hypothetical protein
MTVIREPISRPIAILDLRPTQMTVGFREVESWRKRWREHRGKKADEFLGKHVIPVVLGPKKRHYIIDHHHLARALHEEGVKNIAVTVVSDLSRLPPEPFWFILDNRGWMHPYDAQGLRRDPAEIPKSIIGLVDDPYRSLAGALRRAGGFAKETTPFSEFLWADFLRRTVKDKLMRKNFAHALEKALALAKSKDTDYLPGWCGPVDND